MSAFEYVFTFLTLVLGLGLTKNLTAISELKFSEKRKQNLLDLVWLVAVTLLQIDYWLVLWARQRMQDVWALWQFLIVFAFAIGLYMAGAYIAQASQSEGKDRWRYLKFGINALLFWVVLAVINAIFVLDVKINLLWPALLGAAMLTLALLSRSRLVLFRIATFGFLAFCIFLVGFAGPSTIG